MDTTPSAETLEYERDTLDREIRAHEILIALGRDRQALELLDKVAGDASLAREAAADPRAFAEARGVLLPRNMAVRVNIVADRVSVELDYIDRSCAASLTFVGGMCPLIPNSCGLSHVVGSPRAAVDADPGRTEDQQISHSVISTSASADHRIGRHTPHEARGEVAPDGIAAHARRGVRVILNVAPGRAHQSPARTDARLQPPPTSPGTSSLEPRAIGGIGLNVQSSYCREVADAVRRVTSGKTPVGVVRWSACRTVLAFAASNWPSYA